MDTAQPPIASDRMVAASGARPEPDPDRAAADVRLILPETGMRPATREPAEATVGASACTG